MLGYSQTALERPGAALGCPPGIPKVLGTVPANSVRHTASRSSKPRHRAEFWVRGFSVFCRLILFLICGPP